MEQRRDTIILRTYDINPSVFIGNNNNSLLDIMIYLIITSQENIVAYVDKRFSGLWAVCLDIINNPILFIKI